MKKFLGVILAGVILACDPIPTTLVVKKAFNGIVRQTTPPPCDDHCETEMTVKIPVGTHNSKLEMVSKREMLLTVDAGRSRHSLRLNVPGNANIPNENGSFTLTSRDSGQPFDLKGDLKTQYTRGEQYEDMESCHYVVNEKQCWFDGRREQCRWVSREVWGHQRVSYYLQTTYRHIMGTVTNPKSADDLYANFEGEKSYSEKVYTYKGACY